MIAINNIFGIIKNIFQRADIRILLSAVISGKFIFDIHWFYKSFNKLEQVPDIINTKSIDNINMEYFNELASLARVLKNTMPYDILQKQRQKFGKLVYQLNSTYFDIKKQIDSLIAEINDKSSIMTMHYGRLHKLKRAYKKRQKILKQLQPTLEINDRSSLIVNNYDVLYQLKQSYEKCCQKIKTLKQLQLDENYKIQDKQQCVITSPIKMIAHMKIKLNMLKESLELHKSNLDKVNTAWQISQYTLNFISKGRLPQATSRWKKFLHIINYIDIFTIERLFAAWCAQQIVYPPIITNGSNGVINKCLSLFLTPFYKHTTNVSRAVPTHDNTETTDITNNSSIQNNRKI